MLRKLRFVSLCVTLACGLGFVVATPRGNLAPVATVPSDAQPIFFCFWNVENVFDDKNDPRKPVDEEYDNPFAEDAKLRQQKLDRLAEVLLKMNDGKGPDILACAEVESVRAADLLRATLNKRLDDTKADPKLRYTQVSMKNLDAGRHISTCVLTRLPVLHNFTKLHGRDLRILETRIQVNGHELMILSSHWTSQLAQDNGGRGEAGRAKYADTLFEVFNNAAKKNIHADVIVCGDFNDVPEAKPIFGNLGAVPEAKRVVPTDREPLLLNLLGGKDPNQFGTIWFNGKPLIYDQICVSPGLLDNQGWRVHPETVHVFTDGMIRGMRREPWRFGKPNNPPIGERGFSVTVQLSVQLPQ